MSNFTLDSLAVNPSILANQVQSLCIESTSKGYQLVLGTRGCEILELTLSSQGVPSSSSVSVVTRGHYQDELWGLATHPTRPEYCTVGDDRTLRVWDAHLHTMKACTGLGIMARACAYHPSGNMIAVGFGGRVGRGKMSSQDGLIRIYQCNPLPLTKLTEKADSKKWISDVKFSLDGTILAAGGHQDVVYLYNVRGDGSNVQLTLRAKFSKHNSFITHLDFSADSRYLQSNCGAYELLFSDTSNGSQITSASQLKDVKWATWTCTLGWPVQGIWPPCSDGSDINAVDRSHSGHLVATADDFGKVKVFRYPCLTPDSQAIVSSGHSSHVMNVRWSVADAYLISVGGNDKCVCQWQHTIADMDGAGAVEDGSAKDHIGGGSHRVEEEEDSDSVIASALDVAPAGGDEFMAVKPWLGAIRAPPNPGPISSDPPAVVASLQWVHGYTSSAVGQNNSRVSSNLFYNTEGDAVYPAAALGVRLHKDPTAISGLVQTYFHGHDDDIMCLAISPDRRYVATGQTASHKSKGKGSICVWDALECRLLSQMPGCHQRAVISLAFSPSGQELLSVGQDNNYIHTLWKDVGGGWSRVQQVATEKSDQNTVS